MTDPLMKAVERAKGSVRLIDATLSSDPAYADLLRRAANTLLGDSLVREKALRTILADLLKDYDAESGTIRVGDDAGCIECTVGTVPNSQNTGPCAFHRARAILRTQP